MKLSIWQQFSSNHSGSFSVVGRFADHKEARSAAEKLNAIVGQIDAWHADPANEAAFEYAANNGLRPVTTPEAAARDQYGISLDDQGIDWYGSEHSPIVQVERDVFFSVFSTWCMPEPIAQLLAAWGAQTYSEHEFGAPIQGVVVSLICRFADETAAAVVEAQLTGWSSGFGDTNAAPWTQADDYTIAGYGQVHRETNALHITIEEGLSAFPNLLNWLRMQGAQDMIYQYAPVEPAGKDFS